MQQFELTSEDPIAIYIEHIQLPECGKLVRNAGGWIWFEYGDYTLLDLEWAFHHNPNSHRAVLGAIQSLAAPIEKMYQQLQVDTQWVMKYYSQELAEA
jgi:hypothetical protein